MGWEYRKSKGRVYGPYFISRANGKRQYIGRQPSANQIAEEVWRLQELDSQRRERGRLKAADEQVAAFEKLVDLLVAGHMLASGYHQHNRESHWRKRKHGNNQKGP